jgi:transposase
MGWTGIARREHSREGLRYPNDMTDREWLLTAPFIPPAKTGGRRRTMDMREVVNALLYIASIGGAWRMLPKCFAPVSTVRRYILTDTCGFLVFILVHAADIQDRDGAVDVLKAVRFRFPSRRWVVERTFAWLGRCRRLAKDWETSIASSTAWAQIASIRMLMRRTAKYCYA